MSLVYDRAYHKAYYQEKVNLGLCPHCKEPAEDQGVALCRKCRKYHTEKTAKWREAHPGAAAKQSKRLRDKALLRGDCTRCKVRPAVGRYCEECLAQNKKRRGGRNMRGKCSLCQGKAGRPYHDRRTCPLRLSGGCIDDYASARRDAA